MRKKENDLIIIIILLSFLCIAYYYRANITNFMIKKFIVNDTTSIKSPNNYSKDVSYLGFKQMNDFIPKDKEDLKNIFFTVLDKGWTNFSFYCDRSYKNYMEDIKEMTNDGTFAAINNYVHPYNSYKSIKVAVNFLGIVTIKVEKKYTSDEIAIINSKVNYIMDSIIDNNMNDEEKIRVFHDYLVNNTVYDSEEAKLIDQNISNNLLSYKAYNVLINGIGLCGGYTDSLAIFLSKIGINNFKVATNKHIWNAIYINDGWYHIDATWDDPINGSLIHDYFIISSRKLKNLDSSKHNFDANFYLEVK